MTTPTAADRARAKELVSHFRCYCSACTAVAENHLAAHRLAARREAFGEVVAMMRELAAKYDHDAKESRAIGFSGDCDEGASEVLKQMAETIQQLGGAT